MMKLYQKINEIKLKQKNTKKKIKEISKKEKEIENIFLKTQEDLYIKYFNWLFAKINTIEKAEEFKQKIMEYKIYIIERNNKGIYSEYMQYKLLQIDRKIIEINRKNKKNALSLCKENKLMSMLHRLKEMILKEQ